MQQDGKGKMGLIQVQGRSAGPEGTLNSPVHGERFGCKKGIRLTKASARVRWRPRANQTESAPFTSSSSAANNRPQNPTSSAIPSSAISSPPLDCFPFLCSIYCQKMVRPPAARRYTRDQISRGPETSYLFDDSLGFGWVSGTVSVPSSAL